MSLGDSDDTTAIVVSRVWRVVSSIMETCLLEGSREDPSDDKISSWVVFCSVVSSSEAASFAFRVVSTAVWAWVVSSGDV